MDFSSASVHVGGDDSALTAGTFSPYFQVYFCFGNVDRLSYTRLKSPGPPCSFDLRDEVLGKFSSERAQEIKRSLKRILLNEVQKPAPIFLSEGTCLSHLSGLPGDEAHGSPAGVSWRGCCLGPPCKAEISPQTLPLQNA